MQEMTRTTETPPPQETLEKAEAAEPTAAEERAREEDARSTAPEATGPVRIRRFSSLRARVLLWFIGLLAVATVASVLVARAVLLGQLDERIDAELVQEAEELRSLATGNDPETGEPFRGSVRRIFEVFIERNIPLENEALLTFVGGRPFVHSGDAVPYRLDQDPELVARWSGLQRTERRRIDTPAGKVDYLALPLQSADQTRGVFVVAIFREPEQDEFRPAIIAVGAVGLVILLVGSLLAWRLAEGILRPVRMVTGTAREISESDLGRRIPVEGTDEIARLTSTFNEMLHRLQTAFDTQRRFIDDAGHELRTPITIVRGHLELLEDDPEERRKTLDVVLDELDRMGRIVNDLLLLAKSEEPGFLAREPVDLSALMEELERKVGALAPRDWRHESRDSGIVVADRQRLTQAVLQLADNAVKHTKEGGVITLGSSMGLEEARIWIRDSGPGIPPADRERVFERFARGAGPRRSDGAGLGLAIVRAIAEAHHGRVEVQSRPGEGAMFTIVVPTRPPEGTTEAP
jgi:signal transduction histidine kinase